MRCPKCGKEIASGSNFCEYCGTRISRPNNQRFLWSIVCAIICLSALGVGTVYLCDWYKQHVREVAAAEAAKEEVRRLEEINRHRAEVEKRRAEKKSNETAAQRKAKELARIEADNNDAYREKKRSEESAYREKREKELSQQGYVDLGLPSKTLWKDQNENCGLITYNQAIERYGKSLPTKEQYDELSKYCKWVEKNGGMEFQGANGNTLFFPGEGFRDYDGKLKRKHPNGAYWAVGPKDEPWHIEIWGFAMGSGNSLFPDREGRSVRLVKKL